MSDANLIQLTCETIARYLQLGNEVFEAHGATFVRNRATPRRYDANHVGLIRSDDPCDLDALLQQAEAEFKGMAHRRFDIDALTPPQVEAHLELEGGFSFVSKGLHLLLEGNLRATPRRHDIREMLHKEDWNAYAHLLNMDHIEEARRQESIADLSLTPEWVAYLQAKSPAVHFWLAYVDEMPVGFFNSWPGDNGMGQIEDLFVHPDFRHQGIATALIARAVDDARARGAGPIVITADPDDTPKQMYSAMGFRPLYVGRSYVRLLGD